MKTEERKDLVETTNRDEIIILEEAKGSRENFLIRNNNLNRVNAKPTMNNPVSNALNKNMFRR